MKDTRNRKKSLFLHLLEYKFMLRNVARAYSAFVHNILMANAQKLVKKVKMPDCKNCESDVAKNE